MSFIAKKEKQGLGGPRMAGLENLGCSREASGEGLRDQAVGLSDSVGLLGKGTQQSGQ